jgi:hypothetical protein
MNQFRNKIMKDFEQDLYRCLNLSLDDFVSVFAGRDYNPLQDFEEMFAKLGPAALRDHMDKCINTLSVIYQERELGRRMTETEIAENAVKLKLEFFQREASLGVRFSDCQPSCVSDRVWPINYSTATHVHRNRGVWQPNRHNPAKSTN